MGSLKTPSITLDAVAHGTASTATEAMPRATDVQTEIFP